MVAQERINVRETAGRKNNCKVNLFSMYFVRTKEEIHLSFENSEKKRTQALSCKYPFYWCRVQMKKKEEKKSIDKRKSKQKINNDHFRLKFHNTAFDFIFVQMTFSMSGVSSYNFKNKGKYYLHLRSAEGQRLIV